MCHAREILTLELLLAKLVFDAGYARVNPNPIVIRCNLARESL